MSQDQSQTGSSSANASSQNNQASAGSQVYFIDGSVPGYEALALSLGENSKTFVIENTSDAFIQMDRALASLSSPASSVHIYSHGRDGAILLGGQWIDEAALSQSAEILQRIGQSLAQGADILLYGCNTAASSLGESFIERMARLASVAVAASNDMTGSGGNWTLEKSTGDIETDPVRPGDWLGNLDSGADISGWGVLEGTASSESITGFVTNDRIYGRGGADTLKGGDGDDAYYISGSGTAGTLVVEKDDEGSDTVYSMVNSFDLSANGDNKSSAVEYVVLQAQSGMVAQSATGNDFGQTMVGNDLANNLTGKGGNDLLYGYDGDDFLDGGSGKTSDLANGTDYNYAERNTLIGGKGDDNYIVRGQGDVVIENVNEGTDNVFSFIDYTLGANVENLTLLDGADSSSSARMGIGNALNNVLRGNSHANYLDGGAGNDTLYGSKASDSAGDTLNGGMGNDAYYVYSTNDTIEDSAGNDSVYSTVNYTLGANIENLFLQGGATVGEGNSLNNRIVGNETLGSKLTGGGGTDTLEGGYGDDTFNLSSSADMILDKGGKNTVLSSVTVDLNRFTNAVIETVKLTGSAAINATAQRNVATNLKGNSGNNSLVGGLLNDTLDGGDGGADSLVGGLGNDLYYVRNANTIVTEAVNAGSDTVYAFVDYTLSANVEDLVLKDSARVGAGNNLSNRIDGSTITGGSILHGGANSIGLAGDTLIGGAGNDQIYSYNANDSIEFGGGNDVLYISYAVDNGADMSADDWKDYFSARGVTLTDNVTVVYRGNPVTGSGATSGVSIAGTSLTTNLLGTDKNDTLRAASGTATTLDGGKGSDSMVGSSQDDVFYVDSIGVNSVAAESLLGNVGDIVEAGGGQDTIRSTVNIDLNKTYAIGNGSATSQFSGVEVVELQGTAALSATGNLNASTTLIGNTAANKLFGGDENDVLDGGAGADVMTGGDGDDLYYVDNAGDRVIEKAGEGIDSILTNGININLGTANFANVEYVKNDGSVGISVTGTSGTETIVAGNYGDTIDGKGGYDNITGGDGNDLIYYYGTEQVIDAGDGTDTLYVKNTVSSIDGNAVHNFEVVQLESVAANARAIDIDASGATRGRTLLGNAGNSELKGGSANDYIVGGGGQDTISAGAGDDFVEISANQSGYGALDGGLGMDTLSFGAGADSVAFAADGSITQVISGKTITVNASGFEVYSGGAGNDTLDASATTDGRTLSGGLGNDLLKGGSGADTIIADGGNDTIYTNGGYDTVKLLKEAVGSNITIMDFDTQLDSINDTDLTGWAKTVSQSGADAIVTYINPNNAAQKITVTFKNTVGSDIKSGMTKTIDGNNGTFSAANVAGSVPWQINVTGTGNNVSGGDLNDQLKSDGGNTLDGGAGNDVISGKAGDTLLGGTGNDTISVSGPTSGVSIDGGDGDDTIIVDSLGGTTAATIAGGAGNDGFYINGINGINADGTTTSSISGGDGYDTLYLSGSSAKMHFTGGGNNEISLDSVTLDGNAGTLSVSGIEYYVGTTGADFVDASSVERLNDSNASNSPILHYSTNGGNDTYFGGDAADYVHIGNFGKNSAVSLVGGGNSNDVTDAVIFRGGAAVGITLGANGTVSKLTADGATVNASISGFERFELTDKNDFFDATAHTLMSTRVAEHVYAGGGDDTLIFGDVTAKYYMTAYAEDGNDSVVVGKVSSDDKGKVILDGGQGTDTLTFATNEKVALTFSDATGPSLSYYSDENTISAGDVFISGFEHYKGSNSGNYFDANDLHSVQGSLTLEGGHEHDNFYLGDLASGQVSLIGGKGSDRFHLGSVANGASVFVDGGTDGAAKDKLGFFDQDSSAATNVSLTLDRNGNLGAVSIDGQKANITSSGINAYTGGKGNDTIDASAVTSVDSDDKVMILQGGAGNDLIKSGNIAGGSFLLEGGLGSDTIIGGAGNDRILLGSSDYTDTGNDSITTGGGKDTLVVNALGHGVNTTITDFDVKNDTLDDSALLTAGWAREVTTTSGKTGTTVTYSNGGTSFALNFTNFTNAAFLPSIMAVNSNDFTVRPNFSGHVYGTSESEGIDASDAGACTIYGGGGNDDIHGSKYNDSIIVKGGSDSVTVFGGKGNDTITVDGIITGGNYNLNGTAGTDYISVSTIAGGFVDLEAESVTVDEVRDGTVFLSGDTVSVGSINGGNVTLEDYRDSIENNFYIGNVANNASVTVNGGDGFDRLYFTGSQGLDLTISDITGSPGFKVEGIEYLKGTNQNDYIDASQYSNSGTPVTIHGGDGDDTLIGGANQLLTGGQGDDLLIVTSDSTTSQTWARGGSGTDTLSLASLGSVTADIVDTAAGSGIEGATGKATGISFSSGGTVSLEELEVIALGDAGNSLTLKGKVGATTATVPTFQFGAGVDSLTLTDKGAGSVLRIQGFDSTSANRDKIITTDGWACSSTTVDKGNTKLVYSKAGMANITVWLDGQSNYSEATKGSATTLAAGSTYIGSSSGDTVSIALGGNANTYVNMGPTPVDDKKDYVRITGIAEGSATHTFVASGDSARFYVDGSAGATMMFDDGGNGAADISLKSISIGGKTAQTNTSGFTKYYGTTGADHISVSSVAGDLYDTRHLEYETNGGDDTYLGGAGRDYVHVSGLTGSSKVSLDGGAGQNDILFFDDEKATSMTFDQNGAISQLQVGNQNISGSTFKNFERYWLDNSTNDTITAQSRTMGIGESFEVRTEGGNDRITVGDISLTGGETLGNDCSFNVLAGAGNDTITVGKITSTGAYASFYVEGGAGQDTYQFQASGCNAYVGESGTESDTLEFFGVGEENFKNIASLSESLQFLLTTDGSGTQTLLIDGIDGTLGGDNVLKFSQADFAGDKMNLYTGNGTGQLLSGGSIDLASIVNQLSSSSGWSALTFSQTGTNITATGIKP